MIVYRYKSFIMFKARGGFVVYNQSTEFNSGHTHVQKFHIGKQLIKNVANNKLPRTRSEYLLQSHIRISNDAEYTAMIQSIIDKLDAKHKGKRLYGCKEGRKFSKKDVKSIMSQLDKDNNKFMEDDNNEKISNQ